MIDEVNNGDVVTVRIYGRSAGKTAQVREALLTFDQAMEKLQRLTDGYGAVENFAKSRGLSTGSVSTSLSRHRLGRRVMGRLGFIAVFCDPAGKIVSADEIRQATREKVLEMGGEENLAKSISYGIGAIRAVTHYKKNVSDNFAAALGFQVRYIWCP